jgi:hypothetical protein
MFWLSRNYSLGWLKQLFEDTAKIIQDQYGRYVIYSASENSQSVLQKVLDKNFVNAKLIPCNEETRMYIKQKIHTLA